MYPKSKSPLETKYERLRGMCSGAWGNVRYIPIDNGIQQQGRAWRYMVGAVCISVYLCTICEHSIQPPSPELRNARVRVSRARVCVILLYYYIIILL